ncbi:MAG: S9 family peptidase [Fimbriimonadaceae bacterium]|nr:S9 family peptidase [Fimbriimonadaceae bacterium]
MPKRPIRADDLQRIQFVGDPQVSPDGARVLFAKKHVGENNKYVTNLYTVDRDGNVAQWTQGEAGAGSGRWSPDGDAIAFVSGREKPSAQIFLLSIHGGEARKLTSLPEGSIGGIRWSPDGTKIAFTFREQEPDRTEKAKKEREEKGLSSPPWVMEDIWYRLDGDGYFGPQRHAIYVVEVASGETKKLYDACPIGMYSYDWSPDSTELIVAHSANKRPMAEPPNDQLYRVSLKGQAWMLEGLPKGEKGSVRWSPDGTRIAYAGDVDENDPWGVRNTKLYVVDAKGGDPTCLTAGDDFCLSASTISDTRDSSHSASCEWLPDGKHLVASIGTRGEMQVGLIDAEKGGVTLLTKGWHVIGAGNVSKDGRWLACTFGDAASLDEVALYDLKERPEWPKRMTDLNQAFYEEIELSVPEEVWLDSTDDVKVQAWVMKPIGYLPPKRYPAVLEIHGGPHTQYGWAFFHEFQVLAAEGYVVVFSNPRGSKGYGEAHCAAIRGDWGNKDWEDIQTVTRWMQHQPYIHPGRIGVMGGSYGGYMTNWVIGHTKEFRAAITDRCVSNMVSMAGSSDFPFNKDGYFGGVAWSSLDKIAPLWRQSPIAYFEGVTTPTLIIHSEGDLRCNIEQSEQVFTALQQEGIESRFVRYPSTTSHGMSRSGPPDLRLHRLGEITRWWGKHLK